MDEEYVRTIGSVKKWDFDNDFDRYIKTYTEKAKNLGYLGELKFRVEKGKVIIFAII